MYVSNTSVKKLFQFDQNVKKNQLRNNYPKNLNMRIYERNSLSSEQEIILDVFECRENDTINRNTYFYDTVEQRK